MSGSAVARKLSSFRSRHAPHALALLSIWCDLVCARVSVGRLTQGYAFSQFPPSTLLERRHGVGSAAARDVTFKISLMSTMYRQRRRYMPAEALAVDKEILKASKTPSLPLLQTSPAPEEMK